MFTGLVEEVGTLQGIEPRAAGQRMRFRAATVTKDLREGDSVNVSGVCLTALAISPDGFSADVAPETLRRSNLGALRPGGLVNLERAMNAQGRFGGHIVQGHVDGTGELLALEELGDENWWLRVKVPPELDRYFVFKGSIAIDGISLTLAAVEAGVVAVTVIPHTYRQTALRARRPGDRVNLECDVLAKYVEKMLGTMEPRRPLTLERLKEEGY